jgi:hypothetical protein
MNYRCIVVYAAAGGQAAFAAFSTRGAGLIRLSSGCCKRIYQAFCFRAVHRMVVWRYHATTPLTDAAVSSYLQAWNSFKGAAGL